MHVYTQIDMVKLNILVLILIFAALPHALPPPSSKPQLYQHQIWDYKKADSTKKEALALVFSCNFCEISMNTFFAEHLRATVATFSTIGNAAFVVGMTGRIPWLHLICVARAPAFLKLKS